MNRERPLEIKFFLKSERAYEEGGLWVETESVQLKGVRGASKALRGRYR